MNESFSVKEKKQINHNTSKLEVKMRIMVFSLKWLGHASFQIIANGKVIYIDPFEGEYKEKADIVLVSHSHPDHCDPSKLEKITRPGSARARARNDTLHPIVPQRYEPK